MVGWLVGLVVKTGFGFPEGRRLGGEGVDWGF